MMFSVIIPAYNAALFLKKSIGSILDQTFQDFEILVVDDGSTDDTRELVKTFQEERIRYIYQPNGGVSAARNTGIRNAKGEYICFLDADDLWKPNHLAVISHLIEEYPSANVFLTGYDILLHNGQTITKKCPGVENDSQIDNMFQHIFKHGYFFHTNSISCKKSAFDAVGLFEVGIKNGEDDDMWYRLFAHFSAAVSQESTTIYIRENSRATSSKIFIEDWIFLTRVPTIMSSEEVAPEKKAYLRRLLEQRKISAVRNRILNNDKKTAWRKMRDINIFLLRPSKFFGTILALLLPGCISITLVNMRDKTYYGN